MRARPILALSVVATIALATACAGNNDVSTERSNARPSQPDSPPDSQPQSAVEEPDDDAESATTLAATTTTTMPDPGPVEAPDDSLVFDLERFDLAVSLRETVDLAGDGGPSGFIGATQLPDGPVIALGFSIDLAGPTSAALWTSDDATNWSRVISPPDMGSGPGLATAPAIFSDQRGRALLGIQLLSSEAGEEFGLPFGWSSEDGTLWIGTGVIANSALNNGAVLDGRSTLVGAADPNGAAFTAATWGAPDDGGKWTETLLEPNGEPSLVNDVIELTDLTLAVGATARTDPIGSVETTYIDMATAAGPADAALWRLDGEAWVPIDPDAFAGKTAPQRAVEITAIGDELFLLVVDVIGFQTVPDVYRSADDGESWERLVFPRVINGDVGNNTDLGTARLHAVGDALVITEARNGFDTTRLFMTVVDPEVGDSVTHELSVELEMLDLQQIIEIDGSPVGFGTAISPTGTPKIQAVDFTVVDGASPTDVSNA